MTRWYYEHLTPMGRWAPNAADQEPSVKGANGKRTLRAVTLVPDDHRHLTLDQLTAVYSPDGHLNQQARPVDAAQPAKAAAMSPVQDHIRMLRAATHWAETASKEFAAITAACGGSLVLIQAEGGAITLQGQTTAGLPVSICIAPGAEGPELHLLQSEAIVKEGFAAIRTTELQLLLPRYLARQLAQPAEAA